MSSIFSKIVAGEIPAHKIAETNDFLAFLDIRPLTKGHTLVIPKKEVDYLFDLEEELYIGLQLFARTLVPAIQKATGAARVGVAVVGFEVPHAHIHLIPINQIEEMSFQNERLVFSNEELSAIAASIRESL